MRVLIADDDALARTFVEDLLAYEGYRTVTVDNGEDAWRLFQSEDPPRLAIVDWMMPGMTGLELCRNLQETPVPPYVILLTSRDEGADIVAGLEAGADDYITKPFDTKVFLARVRAGKRVAALRAGLQRKIGELESYRHAFTRMNQELLSSQESYRLLFDRMLNGAMLLRHVVDGGEFELRIIDVNPAYEALSGKSRQELFGKELSSFTSPLPGVEPAWLREYCAVAQTGQPKHFVHHARTSGDYYEVMAYSPCQGLLAVVCADISARRLAQERQERYHRNLEELLAASQEISRTSLLREILPKAVAAARNLLDLDSTAVLMLTEDGQRLMRRETNGLPADVTVDCRLNDNRGLAAYTARTRLPAYVTDHLEERRFLEPEYVRHLGIVSAIAAPLLAEETLLGVLIGHSLTPRRFTLDELTLFQNMANVATIAVSNSLTISDLKESEKKFRELFNNINDPVFHLRLKDSGTPDRILEVNEAACRRYGYKREELLAMKPDAIDLTLKCEEFDLEELFRAGIRTFETSHLTRDGVLVPVEVNARLFKARRSLHLLTIARDITERKRAADTLSAEKEQLAVTLGSIGDGVITTDMGGKIVLLNRVAEELLGWSQEESAGRLLGTVFNIVSENGRKPAINPARRALQSGRIVTSSGRTLLTRRNGAELSVSYNCAPIKNASGATGGVVLVFQDCTAKELAEAEFIRSQKLDSIGVMAGGIAHDFNNILTVILGNLNLVTAREVEGDQALSRLHEAEKAAIRARELTQQLLTFSSKGQPVIKSFNLPGLLRETASFAILGSNVRCDYLIPDDLWPVKGDSGQIAQVFNNLVINGVQAMPGGGVISVRCANLEPPGCDERGLKPGRYVQVEVNDQGHGIPAEYLERVFDPYFTTKATGSGLGLAVVYSVIARHNGQVRVESSAEGTTFTIIIPADQAAVRSEHRTGEAITRGTGHVLVMDDDEMILEVAKKMLEILGYQVSVARDGQTALHLYRQALDEGNAYVAVIMDLTVPDGMGGVEATEQLLRLDPAARVIVSSGYSNNPVMSSFRAYGFTGVVVKPYEIGELAGVLSAVLAPSC
jgi:PAS domain S-box-containing protein